MLKTLNIVEMHMLFADPVLFLVFCKSLQAFNGGARGLMLLI